MDVQLFHGDCLEIMRTMEANSVDSIVTDPPYMLNFMGKAFDKAKDNPAASVDVWAEALRVAKPGAHLLAFGGDRTHHRMMVAIEDAGWEIRTCLYWIFGSGFPKSLDISKQIDKRGGIVPSRFDFARHLKQRKEEKGYTRDDINELLGNRSSNLWSHFTNENTVQPSIPTYEQFQILREVLEIDDHWCEWFQKEAEREVIGKSPHGFGPNNGASLTHTLAAHPDITAPATDAAKQWQGWGTALKPSVEIIVMARKPLIGTIAANVQAWGTGGINVDACRIGVADGEPNKRRATGESYQGDKAAVCYSDGLYNHKRPETLTQGRWPANLLLDEEAAAMLDQMSGTLTSNSKPGMVRKKSSPFLAHANGMEVTAAYGDSGGASRFFARFAHDEDDAPLRFAYIPKASKRDRDEGLEGMEERPSYMVENGSKTSGLNGERYDRTTMARNHHPTVKPTALCRWLVRLVTPPNGTVLDCFAGSGSTGKAAMLEGFNFIGIELDAEYLEIARRRIEYAQGQAAQPPAHMPQLPLLEMTGD